MSAGDPATVADWVGSVGQAAGAIGTFAAVVVALAIARRDGRRAEDDRADREASQARLIVTERRFHREWLVRTTNHSSRPVFDVTLAGGWTAVEREGSPAVVAVLAPGAGIDRRVMPPAEPDTADIVIDFLDAAGLRWRRRGHAAPERVR